VGSLCRRDEEWKPACRWAAIRNGGGNLRYVVGERARTALRKAKAWRFRGSILTLFLQIDFATWPASDLDHVVAFVRNGIVIY